MRVGVVALDGMLDSGLTAMLDIMSTADQLASQVDVPGPVFEVVRYGPGEAVRTAQGLQLDTTPWPSAHEDPPELLVLPALGLRSPQAIVEAVRDHPVLRLVGTLFARGIRMAAACSGTFFLAEAGLLDGRRATTSWWLGPAFRARYPGVDLDDDRALLVDGPVTTAGAAFSHIDLALSLVHRRSPGLAELVSRYLVIGERPSQASVAMPSVLASANPVLAAFERVVREHLARPLSIAQMARAIGTTERTLQRVTAMTLGVSPLRFVQEVRLEHAAFLLRTTDRSTHSVAQAVGYRNAGSLRSLMRRGR